MASVKDLRTKPLSEMSADELKSYISTAEGQGYTISESKDLGKAVDLLKVLDPSGYGSETVASAKNKLASNTTLDTQQKLGIAPSSGTSSTSSSSPFGSFSGGQGAGIDLNKMYEQAINDPALKALEEELNAKKQARDTEEAKINDNPFYSEATRVGKLSKLDAKALDEINTLQSQIDAKKADALVKINIATQQYNIEDKQYQNNLAKLNTLINSGAIVGATSSDVAQIAQATGMSTEMVNQIIQTTKQGQVQTSVTTNTDDNGNVTVSVINTKTGEVIAQNSLGAIGNKQGTSTTVDKQEAKFDSEIERGISRLKDGEDWGTVWNSIFTKFRGIGADEDLILAIDAGLGTSWREAGAYEAYKTKQAGGQ